MTEEEYPTAMWHRICTLTSGTPFRWPDMERERFIALLSREIVPRPMDIAKIAQTFGTTPEWIITGGSADHEAVIAELRHWCHAQIAHQQSLDERITVLTQRLEALGGDVSG